MSEGAGEIVTNLDGEEVVQNIIPLLPAPMDASSNAAEGNDDINNNNSQGKERRLYHSLLCSLRYDCLLVNTNNPRDTQHTSRTIQYSITIL